MTRKEALIKISEKLYLDYSEANLQEFSDTESNWKEAEDILKFWLDAKDRKLKPQWISAEKYDDWLRFRRIVEQVE